MLLAISISISLSNYNMKANYYIYIVGISHPRDKFQAGDVGVGFTSFAPGIKDCRYGTLMIAPNSILDHQSPNEYMIRRAVLLYFGYNGC